MDTKLDILQTLAKRHWENDAREENCSPAKR